mmetsp:Transcript_98792/g.205946  ORF Transcript_98792/g.205946 Transcript_98792/m.205946 type:complete len:336 (-) Transcript_98792:140-1147(-)
MASDEASIDFNHFEWILDNEVVIPVLLRWSKASAARIAGKDEPEEHVHVGPASLALPGVGSSALEDFPPEAFSPVVGLDVDRAALEEAAKRTRTRPDIRWLSWDLTIESRPGIQEEIKHTPVAELSSDSGSHPSRAGLEVLPDSYDIVLDKGTLDYVICEEVSKCCSYLRNMRALVSSGLSRRESGLRPVYVLISFRARSLLLQLLGIFDFELLEEIGDLEVGSNTKQRASIYVMGVRPPDIANSREDEEARFQEAMDLHYRNHSPLTGGEGISSLMSVEKCSLNEAWKLLIPEEMQVEYDFNLFCEDLEASQPEALRRGFMTGPELVSFLEQNQ